MAILSNINGKFAVDSTGAIQLSGSAGAANEVLVSGGAGAAPTWVAASTVIGGPYLPLTGGILTGATATSTGISFTVGGALIGNDGITLGGSNKTLETLYNGTTSYRGALGWSYLQMGNNGSNDIIGGNTAAGGFLRFFTNNTNYGGADVAPNGTLVLTLQADGTAYFTGSNNNYDGTIRIGERAYIEHRDAGQTTTSIISNYNNDNAKINFKMKGVADADAQMTILGSGNVGIGTTTPGAKLSVQNTSTAVTSLLLGNNSGSTGDYQQIVFQYSQTDTSYRSAIRSRVQAGGVHGGNLSFWTDQNGTTTLTERMTIDRVGNVGIGTASPTQKLHIYDGAGGGSAPDARTKLLIEDDGEAYLTFNVPANQYSGIRLQAAGTVKALAEYYATANSLHIGTIDATGTLEFHTTNSVKMIIAANGNVGIGTTSPDGSDWNASSKLLHIYQNDTNGGLLKLESSNTTGILAAGNNQFQIGTIEAQPLKFYTGGSERMRIQASGYTKIKDDGDTTWDGYDFHAITQSRLSEPTVMIYNDNTDGNNYGINVIHRSSGSSTTGRFFLGATSNGVTEKIKIYTNGSIENATNSYGQLSDLKLKENVVDATGKLDDIMKVKIKNFNYIGEDLKQIGVIAQEVEEVFPGLIYETPDTEIVNKKEVPTGSVTKGVKYSVFVPMLIKSIQELEARVKELENN